MTIKIRNKKTRVIGATNIAFINTPDGFNAKSITQLVQTTVRASATDIDTIAANNLARGGGFVRVYAGRHISGACDNLY